MQLNKILAKAKAVFVKTENGRVVLPKRTIAYTLVCAVSLITAFNVFGVGVKATVNGEESVYVPSESALQQAVEQVEAHASEVLGTDYSYTPEISYSFVIVPKTTYTAPEEVTEVLSGAVDEISNLAALSIDGEIVGYTGTIIEANAVLDRVAARYADVTDDTLTVDFVEDVSVDMVEAPSESVLTEAALYDALFYPDTERYTAAEGDTLHSVALSFGTQQDRLLEWNPSLLPEEEGADLDTDPNTGEAVISLDEGTELIIPITKCRLSVQVSSTVTSYNEIIPFETTYIENDTWSISQQEVLQEGIDAQADITREYIYVNGELTNTYVLDTVYTVKGQNEILEVGTIDYTVGTGDMIRPFAAGKVTSDYGYRGGEFHTGVDFAGPTGSDVVAADNGTVIFAGSKGSYGNCVILDHGNGLQTLYAHNSALTVSEGDVIAKGTVIAKVGSTGRSTGPHCHFEVREGTRFDDHVNPWNYID